MYSDLPNKCGGLNKREVGSFFHLCRRKYLELGLLFHFVGKTSGWETFIKIKKMCITLIREVRVVVRSNSFLDYTCYISIRWKQSRGNNSRQLFSPTQTVTNSKIIPQDEKINKYPVK